MKTKRLLAAALVSALFVTQLLRMHSKQVRLQEELAAARAAKEQADAEIAELKVREVPATELARLKADQREAIKLRGEVSVLKQIVSAAQRDGAGRSKPKGSKAPDEEAFRLLVSPTPDDNPEVSVHKTPLVGARVPLGNVVALGGWPTSSGKRAFVFLQPNRDTNSPGAITINSKLIEIPPEEAAKFFFGQHLGPSGEEMLLLEGADFSAMIEQLERRQGVDLLTPPVVSTASGQQAQISVTEKRTTLTGPVDFGSQFDVLPTLSEDGKLDLELRAVYVEDSPEVFARKGRP